MNPRLHLGPDSGSLHQSNLVLELNLVSLFILDNLPVEGSFAELAEVAFARELLAMALAEAERSSWVVKCTLVAVSEHSMAFAAELAG